MMMKKSLLGVVLSSLVLLGSSMDVDAKRLGGSKSMGKQNSSVTQKQATPAAAPAAPAAQPAPAAKPAPAASPAATQPKKGFGMGGILGGLAAGLGIGWLLSHFGLGEAAASFFMGLLIVMAVAMVAMFLFRKFAGSQAKYKTSPAGGPQWDAPQTYERQEPVVSSSSAPAVETPRSSIQNFDQESFLLNAKKHFVHLQEAWDNGDLLKLQEFATVEMFEELRQDLAARANVNNRTEVLTLDAELLGIETAEDVYLASVKFSGMIREQADGAAESFVEVWNLTKPVNGQGGWVLAGIQQLV